MKNNNVKMLVSNLFTYVKEIKTRLEAPILSENKYDWILNIEELPNHPYIFRSSTEDYFLKVKRPKVVECPPPPSEIVEWIKPSWKFIDKDLDFLKSRNIENDDGTIVTVYIEEFPDVVQKIEKWTTVRNAWKEAELPSESVRKVFSHLHEVKARIEKDSEGIQLYLTEGVLSYKVDNTSINHPLVYKEIGIELLGDKSEPEILVTKSNSDSSLYVTLLRALQVSGASLNKLKHEFSNLDIDPDNDKIDLFLKGLIHRLWQNGKFSDSKVQQGSDPTVFLELKMILGRKESSFAEQIDNYVKKIDELDELPVAYQNMVGFFEERSELPPKIPASYNSERAQYREKKKDYYLTKAYNSEQKKIIDLLDDNGCVSVQGPPGTGKSHTIANLVGHLLAKGQSVLISSHRSKALEVIRDQVVEDIRPLCVSILDDQKSNKEQLQKAVNFLEELTTKNNSGNIDREINELKIKREKLLDDINKFESEYLKCIQSEYTPIPFQGSSILPKDAALFIASHTDKTFINGPFSSDVDPVSEQILGELKSSIRTLEPSDYSRLRAKLPPVNELLSTDDFQLVIIENSSLEQTVKSCNSQMLNRYRNIDDFKLKNIVEKLNLVIKFFNDPPDEYLRAMMDFILRGDQYVSTFLKFVEDTESSLDEINALSHLVFEHAPELKSDHNIDELIKCAENIHDTSGKEVRFSFFAKLFSTEMKILKNEVKVHGRELRTKEEILSVVNLLKISKIQAAVCERWDNLIFSRLGAVSSDAFSRKVEVEVAFRLKGIKKCLELKSVLDIALNDLKEIGVEIPSGNYEEIKFKTESLYQDLDGHLEEINKLVIMPGETVLEEHRVRGLTKQYELSLKIAKDFSDSSEFNRSLYCSLKDKRVSDYNKYYSELCRLSDLIEVEVRFSNICNDVSKIAPRFADDLFERRLDDEILDTDCFNSSWKASYLEYVISGRNSVSPMDIHDKLISSKVKLERLDSILIRKMAIGNQLKKITSRQRQALRGFVIAQNKMTKSGKGVRDVTLRKESKNQMKECRGAVPVWIMPLSKVMDNFVIGEDAFDVLIIDEASQADITNLPIFSIAKKVIVVGDDKQVSPAAAGVSLSGVDELINEFLQGIPNKAIYDYKASLYDIACSSFGETIRLTEHFRCTPEIIQFCNDLQYQGNIRPLRESNSNPTPPSLVPFYIAGSINSSKQNIEEAKKIATIIAAMTTIEKYKTTTIGVISMFGNQQHQLIDSFLRSLVSSTDYERHKILCGKSAEFQGDERNIVFLSMVESPASEGPMRRKSETDKLKKEYNVAVSRAKDQLWIMHSMNKDIHLQSDDIRLKLLNHAHDPRDLTKKHSHLLKEAESHFEESVHKDLLRGDYKFQPQFPVGAYRIDIVLFTKDGKRIALECDGEKFHHTEQHIKNDLARQAVLERIGFTFIRIRGSDYYRRREETVELLYRRLDELNVVKGNEVSTDNSLDISVDQELLLKADEFRKDLEERLEENEI